jgi:hypothetical protein
MSILQIKFKDGSTKQFPEADGIKIYDSCYGIYRYVTEEKEVLEKITNVFWWRKYHYKTIKEKVRNYFATINRDSFIYFEWVEVKEKS